MRKINAKSILGSKLIELRRAKGLTQPQLASALGVSRDTIAYYETKSKNPTTEFVQKTADFFDVPFDQLLAGAEQPRKKPGPVSAIEKRLNQVCSLPPDEQKFVIKFLDQVLASKKVAKTG